MGVMDATTSRVLVGGWRWVLQGGCLEASCEDPGQDQGCRGAGAHLRCFRVLIWDVVRSDGFSCTGGTRVVVLGGTGWHHTGMAVQRVLSPT